jgi:hypothetical protein
LWQDCSLENERRAAHIYDMKAGWKFVGEFKRGRESSLFLECIVAVRDRKEAEAIAHKKLIGADAITVTELSRAELAALRLKDGCVLLEPHQTP